MLHDSGAALTLFKSLDMVVLVHKHDGYFRWLTPPTGWARQLISDAENPNEPLDVGAAMPFVEFFLDEANDHWNANNGEILLSGEFVEDLASGEQIALQARAVIHDGDRMLILEKLGERFERYVEAHQVARETMLTRDHMENEIRRITRQIRDREEEISMRLLCVTGIRDVETGEHVRRIGMYSEAVARALGWNAQQAIDIRIAAPMHDIGKVGIPDRILMKPGKLTDAEYLLMQQHAVLGAEMLSGSDIPLLEMAREIALSHHERWDGAGYPDGLKGSDIPLSARIVSVCDVYDALMHERVYKPAYSEAKTISMMREQSGRHFDPVILKCFLDCLPEIRRIRESVMDAQLIETDPTVIGKMTGTLG